MFDKRGLAIGGVIVCVLLLIMAARTYWLSPENRLETVLNNIESCIEERNATVCSRPFIEEALSFVQGRNVLDELEKRFTEQQCHYIGHVVGQ